MSNLTAETFIKLNKLAESHTYLFCYLIEEQITEDQAQDVIGKAEAWLDLLGEMK